MLRALRAAGHHPAQRCSWRWRVDELNLSSDEELDLLQSTDSCKLGVQSIHSPLSICPRLKTLHKKNSQIAL